MSEATTEKKRRPLRGGRFVVPDDPKKEPYLIASKCGNCGKYFVPPRVVCLNCGKVQMEPAALSGKGTLYSFTVVHQQLPFALVKVPYAIGIVALEEGCQIHGAITEGVDSLKVGMPIEVYFEKAGEDDEGNELLVDKYRAVRG